MKFKLSTFVILSCVLTQANAGPYSPSSSEVMAAIKPGAVAAAKNRVTGFSVTSTSVPKHNPSVRTSRRVLTARGPKLKTSRKITAPDPLQRLEQSDPNWRPSALSGAPEWVPIFDLVDTSSRTQTRNSLPDTPTPPPAQKQQDDMRKAPETTSGNDEPTTPAGTPAGNEPKTPPGDEPPAPPTKTPPAGESPEDNPPPPPVIPVDDIDPNDLPPTYPPVDDVPPAVAVPEPSTAALLMLGIAAIGLGRRRRS